MNVIRQKITDEYALYEGDSVLIQQGLPDNSIGLSVFSPPFADLYTYSDIENDMGNCRNYNDFFVQFRLITRELERVMMPGRSVAIHCMAIPSMKERDGVIGLKDFPGDIIRLFQEFEFIYHSDIVIGKNPLLEAMRTRAIGLQQKQILKDSSMCRQGIPDRVVVMRKLGENKEPIKHHYGMGDYSYFGSNEPKIGTGSNSGYSPEEVYSQEVWRSYADPIWSDIRQTETLNKSAARAEKDEKHICPLQLDTVGRCIALWSNPGDTVLSPFGGIGTEPYQAIMMDRKAIAIDLKSSYYNEMVLNMEHAVNKKKQGRLF